MLVADIYPAATGATPNNSFPSDMTNVNGEIYFSANDGVHGVELWKSDGTAAGTMMVKDIDPAQPVPPNSSFPFDLAAVNGALEFYAYDGTGTGLFRSDGTAAGTVELATNVQTTTPLGVTAPPAGDFNRDFNADGFSDIQWHNNNGQVAIWEMNGTNQIAGGSQILAPNPGPGWNEIGAGDFNRDGHSDILWQSASGQIAIWEMNGTNMIGGGTVSSNPGPSWKAVGTGDFNADGAADILFQNANGQAAIWEMNGTNIIGGGAVSPNPGPGWTAVGTGDFNGDGHSDILWQNASSGQTAIWEMNGTSIIGGGTLGINAGPGWKAVGTGDFNGDGHSDILFQNTGNGQAAIWEMNGTNVIGGGTVSAIPGNSLACDRNERLQRRRPFRHPVAEHERPGRDLGDERDHPDPRRQPGPRRQSGAQLARGPDMTSPARRVSRTARVCAGAS